MKQYLIDILPLDKNQETIYHKIRVVYIDGNTLTILDSPYEHFKKGDVLHLDRLMYLDKIHRGRRWIKYNDSHRRVFFNNLEIL